MKIKYTGLTNIIFITIPISSNNVFMQHFVRNKWYDVEDEIVIEKLLKSPYFVCKEDFIFSHSKIKDTILLQRGYALGDLIQLIPVVKYMKRAYGYKFDLLTSGRFVEIMKWYNVFENVFSQRPKKKYRNFYILDGVLESDHSTTNHRRTMHRIKIFEEFFNIHIDKYDFGRI